MRAGEAPAGASRGDGEAVGAGDKHGGGAEDGEGGCRTDTGAGAHPEGSRGEDGSDSGDVHMVGDDGKPGGQQRALKEARLGMKSIWWDRQIKDYLEAREANRNPKLWDDEEWRDAKLAGTRAVIAFLYLYAGAFLKYRVTRKKWFQNCITFAIIVASVLVGMQTYEAFEETKDLEIIDTIILYIFTLECVLKIWACGEAPLEYFSDNWNRFDFIVVAVCYMPLDASMVTVLRLFRLLRVLKLVKALPELQVLVMGLLSSVSSIFYVGILLFLVFYLYAVLAISLFRDNDPVHFPNLQTTFLSLFRMATFDDYTDIMYTQMHGCDRYPPFWDDQCETPEKYNAFAAIFFISFEVLASFIVLNLFVGVISGNMEAARAELKTDRGDEDMDEEETNQRLLATVEYNVFKINQHFLALHGELKRTASQVKDLLIEQLKSEENPKSQELAERVATDLQEEMQKEK